MTSEEKQRRKEDEIFERIIDYCIVDWKFIVFEGEELECTLANKLKLVKSSPEFVKFLIAAMKELKESK